MMCTLYGLKKYLKNSKRTWKNLFGFKDPIFICIFSDKVVCSNLHGIEKWELWELLELGTAIIYLMFISE